MSDNKEMAKQIIVHPFRLYYIDGEAIIIGDGKCKLSDDKKKKDRVLPCISSVIMTINIKCASGTSVERKNQIGVLVEWYLR